MKFAELAAVEFPRRPSGIDSCPPQRLVGVNVPYARQNALVEEGRLDRNSSPNEPLPQVACRKRALERLQAEAGSKIGVDLVGCEH